MQRDLYNKAGRTEKINRHYEAKYFIVNHFPEDRVMHSRKNLHSSYAFYSFPVNQFTVSIPAGFISASFFLSSDVQEQITGSPDGDSKRLEGIKKLPDKVSRHLELIKKLPEAHSRY